MSFQMLEERTYGCLYLQNNLISACLNCLCGRISRNSKIDSEGLAFTTAALITACMQQKTAPTCFSSRPVFPSDLEKITHKKHYQLILGFLFPQAVILFIARYSFGSSFHSHQASNLLSECTVFTSHGEASTLWSQGKKGPLHNSL